MTYPCHGHLIFLFPPFIMSTFWGLWLPINEFRKCYRILCKWRRRRDETVVVRLSFIHHILCPWRNILNQPPALIEDDWSFKYNSIWAITYNDLLKSGADKRGGRGRVVEGSIRDQGDWVILSLFELYHNQYADATEFIRITLVVAININRYLVKFNDCNYDDETLPIKENDFELKAFVFD